MYQQHFSIFLIPIVTILSNMIKYGGGFVVRYSFIPCVHLSSSLSRFFVFCCFFVDVLTQLVHFQLRELFNFSKQNAREVHDNFRKQKGNRIRLFQRASSLSGVIWQEGLCFGDTWQTSDSADVDKEKKSLVVKELMVLTKSTEIASPFSLEVRL